MLYILKMRPKIIKCWNILWERLNDLHFQGHGFILFRTWCDPWKHNFNILGIKRAGKTDVSVTPDTILSDDITILALGEYKALQKCFRIWNDIIAPSRRCFSFFAFAVPAAFSASAARTPEQTRSSTSSSADLPHHACWTASSPGRIYHRKECSIIVKPKKRPSANEKAEGWNLI